MARRQELELEAALLARDIDELTVAVGDPQQRDAYLDQIAALSDPGGDRILFFDDSGNLIAWLNVGTNLSITGTTLNAAGGASVFTALTDAPASYAGSALKVVRVNAGETALEFVTLAGGGDALVGSPLSQFASTTSLQLKGVMSDETGSGALVFANAPALVNPTGIVKGDVGLGSVDNTSDAGKPVSTAQQTALDLKANLASPTFTGAVGGISKSMVGLGSVVNADTSTTTNITDATNKRFVTDANLTTIGNQSGTNTGDQTSVSGNAGTATALQTPRTINGTSFNGTANIMGVLNEVSNVLAASYSMVANSVAVIAAPYTINPGVSLTIPSTSKLVILHYAS